MSTTMPERMLKVIIQRNIRGFPIFQGRFWISKLVWIFSHEKILVLKQFNIELLTADSKVEIHKQ